MDTPVVSRKAMLSRWCWQWGEVAPTFSPCDGGRTHIRRYDRSCNAILCPFLGKRKLLLTVGGPGILAQLRLKVDIDLTRFHLEKGREGVVFPLLKHVACVLETRVPEIGAGRGYL